MVGKTKGKYDLGSGFSYDFFSWNPDRRFKSNRERYKDIPNINKAGIIIWKNGEAVAAPFFNTTDPRIIGDRASWEVHSLDPLHLEPSIQMYDNDGSPSYHGHIRGGKWTNA